MKGKCCGLHVCGFGLAIGVSWAIGMFAMGLLALFFGWGTAMVTSFSELYIGYAPTFIGSIIGAIWGFVDGFIFGVLIAWFYNIFLRCCPTCKGGGVCKTEE